MIQNSYFTGFFNDYVSNNHGTKNSEISHHLTNLHTSNKLKKSRPFTPIQQSSATTFFKVTLRILLNYKNIQY